MFDKIIEENFLNDKYHTKCMGNVYKGQFSQYLTKNGFAQTIRLVKQERLSCPGCNRIEISKNLKKKYCASQLDDYLSDELEHESILGIDEVQDGKYYHFKMVNMSTDWETGYLDGWDLELIQINDELIPKIKEDVKRVKNESKQK